MKKTYHRPAARAVTLETEQPLLDSSYIPEGPPSDNFTTNRKGKGNNNSMWNNDEWLKN